MFTAYLLFLFSQSALHFGTRFIIFTWHYCAYESTSFQNIFQLQVALWLASIGGDWHAVVVSRSDDVQYQNPVVIVDEDASVCCSKNMDEFC